MVCVVGFTPSGALSSGCGYVGYVRNESFIQKIETDAQNNEVVFYMGENYPRAGWVYLNGKSTWVSTQGSKEYIKESALPTWEAVVLFFYNYWYLIALIILGITLASAL